MKKILLPIDRSELSQQSFSFAEKIAKSLESKLVIVSVIELLSYSPAHNEDYVEQFISHKDFMERETSEILEKAKAYFDGSGIEVETKILWGSPADKILDYSEDGNFNLIIMNTQGMSASKRFVIGSVANKVVKHATVPVMVVR